MWSYLEKKYKNRLMLLDVFIKINATSRIIILGNHTISDSERSEYSEW